MNQKRGYKFTNKKHPEKGIMSVILGIVGLVYLILAVYGTYQSGGEAGSNYGLVGLLVTLFSAGGLILGVLAKSEPDKYPLFSYLGIGVNIVVLGLVSFILYAGAYGL